MSNRVDDGAPRANASQNGQDEAGRASAARRKSRFRSLGRSRKPFYAAVDLGTNNCRLLIVNRRMAGSECVTAFRVLCVWGRGWMQPEACRRPRLCEPLALCGFARRKYAAPV